MVSAIVHASGGASESAGPGATGAHRAILVLVGSTLHWGAVAAVVFIELMALLVVGLVLSGRPRLELTPDAIRLPFMPGPLGGRVAQWAELVPDQPTSWPGPHSLSLFRNLPGGTWPVLLGLHHVRIHPAFLADTIRFYADHPERRPRSARRPSTTTSCTRSASFR